MNQTSMSCLLAIDIGLKTGLALYGRDGRLCWYRSHNFVTPTRLRRGSYRLLNDISGVKWLVLEGGGNLAEIWKREADRRFINVMQINAEIWRKLFLYPREQRSGSQAKHNAGEIARRAIEWSGASRPKSLRHDAAEAILIGLWGVHELGWLKDLTPVLKR